MFTQIGKDQVHRPSIGIRHVRPAAILEVQISCHIFVQSQDNFHYSLTILKLETNVPVLGNIPIAFYVACSYK